MENVCKFDSLTSSVSVPGWVGGKPSRTERRTLHGILCHSHPAAPAAGSGDLSQPGAGILDRWAGHHLEEGGITRLYVSASLFVIGDLLGCVIGGPIADR